MNYQYSDPAFESEEEFCHNCQDSLSDTEDELCSECQEENENNKKHNHENR